MKTYQGRRDEDTGKVSVTVKAEGHPPKILNHKKSLRVRRHSPDGFNWGYSGSGPAQLALAILLDLYPEKGDDWAHRIHQRFKFSVIAKLSEDTWTLTTDDIDLALMGLTVSKDDPPLSDP